MSGFLLDTNVISEAVNPVGPEPAVIAWLESADPNLLFVSVLTFGEIRRGIEKLAEGRRKRELQNWLETSVASWFGDDQILPVTRGVSESWAVLWAKLRREGFQISTEDGLIAATALVHELTIVTRNVKHFEQVGVPIVNPWDANEQ